MRERLLKSVLYVSAAMVIVGATAPASALKKTAYPEVKIEISEAFQPDSAFNAMRQAFSAAVGAKNADALFALVGPTFVWTAEGGPTDEFDMGLAPVDNFKVVFGFRAPHADKDGGVAGGPFWDALTAFAADSTFFKHPDAGNLVCGPLAAQAVNDATFAAARKKVETDEEAALWYYTASETPVTQTPEGKGNPVAKVVRTALPVIGLHPPQDDAKPTHIEVLLPSGKSGWIPVASARPLASNRLCYSRTPTGEWKISAFDQNED